MPQLSPLYWISMLSWTITLISQSCIYMSNIRLPLILRLQYIRYRLLFIFTFLIRLFLNYYRIKYLFQDQELLVLSIAPINLDLLDYYNLLSDNANITHTIEYTLVQKNNLIFINKKGKIYKLVDNEFIFVSYSL